MVFDHHLLVKCFLIVNDGLITYIYLWLSYNRSFNPVTQKWLTYNILWFGTLSCQQIMRNTRFTLSLISLEIKHKLGLKFWGVSPQHKSKLKEKHRQLKLFVKPQNSINNCWLTPLLAYLWLEQLSPGPGCSKLG